MCCVYLNQMWSVEYVQVPDETKLVVPVKSTKGKGNSTQTVDVARVTSLEASQPKDIPSHKKRSTSCDVYAEDNNQSAVDRLKDFKDPDNMNSKLVELGSSVDSNSHFMSKLLEKLEGSGTPGRESQSAIERNISTSSSISDLYGGEEIGNVDGELNNDVEVQSVKSAGGVSVGSAVEATESAESVVRASSLQYEEEKVGESLIINLLIAFDCYICFCYCT